MLTKRQENILKLIVMKYIELAKPVSSNLICKKLKCSSATVRNEMVELENLGLLEKTHTSSGRVPSEAGYRYYVDHLMQPKEMNGEEMLKLQIIFKNQNLVLSDCLKKSLQLISDMTNYTSIVLGKASHENQLKEINVVPLDKENMIIIDPDYFRLTILPPDKLARHNKESLFILFKDICSNYLEEILFQENPTLTSSQRIISADKIVNKQFSDIHITEQTDIPAVLSKRLKSVKKPVELFERKQN